MAESAPIGKSRGEPATRQSLTAERCPDTPPRFHSVDALRGWAAIVFFLTSAAIPALSLVPGAAGELARQQLSRSVWHGLTIADLIFPTFLVVMGVSLELNQRKWQAEGVGLAIQRRSVFIRALFLFLLGLLLEAGWLRFWPELRLAGWLQQMAVCYLIGALFLVERRTVVVVAVLLLVLVDFSLLLALAADDVTQSYATVGNAAAGVDALLLPGRKYFGNWDSAGVLTTLPALVFVLAGILLGRFMLSEGKKDRFDKVIVLILSAAVVGLAANLLSFVVPINSHLATPSFVLLALAIILAVQAVFHWTMDGPRGCPAWLAPPTVVGRNCLLAVALVELVPFEAIRVRAVDSWIGHWHTRSAVATVFAVELLLFWLLLKALHRENRFLTVRHVTGWFSPPPPPIPCGETPASR